MYLFGSLALFAINTVVAQDAAIPSSNEIVASKPASGGEAISPNKVIANTVATANGSNIMLVIQNAASANLFPDLDHKGRFTLTLNKVENVLVFSDRSPIFVGRLENSDFVNFWNTNIRHIASNPPTAALVSKSFSPLSGFGSHNDVFYVTNPSYDPARKAFSYQVNVVGDFYIKAGIYENVTLFLTQRLDQGETDSLRKDLR